MITPTFALAHPWWALGIFVADFLVVFGIVRAARYLICGK